MPLRRRRAPRAAILAAAAALMMLAVACALVPAARAQAQPARSGNPLAVIDSMLATGKTPEALALAEKQVKLTPDVGSAWFLLARARHASKDYEGAIAAGERAATFPEVRASAWYNIACAQALLGRRDAAFASLHKAKWAGFSDRDLMTSDPDLASLRGDPRFVLPVKREYHVLDVGDTKGLPYSIDRPVHFDSTKTYPVLVGPGDAEPHPSEFGSLYWGQDACERGWVVVETPAFVLSDPVAKMRKLLDHIAAKFHVEGGKFHLVGIGANSSTAFEIAEAMPERFQSLTAVPGYPVAETDEPLKKLRGIEVSFIVGGHDPVFLGETRLAYQRLRDIGVTTYLEIVPGAGSVMTPLFGGEFMNRMEQLRPPHAETEREAKTP